VEKEGTLAFAYSTPFTYPHDVSGEGFLHQAGSGTLTLTGHNTYTGGTIIDAGCTLRVTGGGTLGGGHLVVNGTLELEFSGTVKQSDVMAVTTATGSGEIILKSGTLITDTFKSSTVPVRVLDGASYTVSTPDPSVMKLEGGTGSFASGNAVLTDFSDPNLWQANGMAEWISPGVARVTRANPSGTGTLILKEPILAAKPWEASFTYTMAGFGGNVPADGFSMFVHNRSDGATAMGGGATGSGVDGIRTAYGFILNVYPGVPAPFWRFCWVENGYLQAHNERVADLNGVEPENGVPVNVRFVYDGIGLMTVTLEQSGNVYTTSRAVDLSAQLGGLTGWFGFGGGTGGETADQQISNMTLFTTLSHTSDLSDSGLWALNGTARVISDGIFQLTPRENGKSGSIIMKERLSLSKKWQVSFRYDNVNRQDWDNHDWGSADGFSVFVHNDWRGTSALGGTGGGNGYTGLSPLSGFTVNIFAGGGYGFAWVDNFDWGGGIRSGESAFNPNGVTPWQGNMYVTMEYDGNGLLKAKLSQGGNSYAATRTIDLAATVGVEDAWLHITGATGGVSADQRISQLKITYFNDGYDCPNYGASVSVGLGTGNSTLYGAYLPPDITADTLTLYHGAALDIQPNALLRTDASYSLTFQNVVSYGKSSVTVYNNGAGAGTLTFGNFYVDETSGVAFTGNVTFPGGVLTIHARPNLAPGHYLIAEFDSTTASKLSLANFFLEPTAAPERAKLIWRGNRLYLSLIQGTVLILR